MQKKELRAGIHYYLEGERVIFTALFHSERGECCGNGCRHCPYRDKHKKGTKILIEEFGYLRENT
jgi:hypothetical protein